MSQAGPILFVSNAGRPAFASALGEARLFPLIDSDWANAARAVDQIQPAAVFAVMSGASEVQVAAVARKVADQPLYLPLVAVDAEKPLPPNALPFSLQGASVDRLIARLRAALRVRTLHATVLRRLPEVKAKLPPPDTDPARDATVLLIGRGADVRLARVEQPRHVQPAERLVPGEAQVQGHDGGRRARREG